VTYFGRKESVATLALVEEAPEPNAEPDSQGTRIVTTVDSEFDADALWDALNLSAHENYELIAQQLFQASGKLPIALIRLNPPQQEHWQKQHTVTLAVSVSPRL